MGDSFTEKKFRESQQFGTGDEVTTMPVDEMTSPAMEAVEPEVLIAPEEVEDVVGPAV
jgi:hypothetical protein